MMMLMMMMLMMVDHVIVFWVTILVRYTNYCGILVIGCATCTSIVTNASNILVAVSIVTIVSCSNLINNKLLLLLLLLLDLKILRMMLLIFLRSGDY